MEAKKDCFAYSVKNGKEECSGLKEVYCKYEDCHFYKTRAKLVADIKLSMMGTEE